VEVVVVVVVSESGGGTFECGVGRTWVGGKADYLGTSKAVTVVALRTNKEGRDIGCRGIPPTLEAGNVYVLSRKSVFESDAMRYVIRLAWVSVSVRVGMVTLRYLR
jgi:hypothetical protein